MEGGNEATSGSGVTQFAEGEPKSLYPTLRSPDGECVIPPTRSVPDWKWGMPKSAFSEAKPHPLARAARTASLTPLPPFIFTSSL